MRGVRSRHIVWGVIYIFFFIFILSISSYIWTWGYFFMDFSDDVGRIFSKGFNRGVKYFSRYINYINGRRNGSFYSGMDDRKRLEEDFYNLLCFNYEIDRIKTPFGREEVKKDLVDVMILLKKYKMAGYVIESEIKKVVDKDRYLEKYTPLLSYIYYKVGNKDKSDKYMSEFIFHLKSGKKLEEERKEIEKKRDEILKKKGRYFKYKKDYYDFLLGGLK